ncbi:MAG: hypothetical protein E6H57_15860 [Betaproteobacteria bacterium]|nr:MAG: hypothetical protein E6H57_15860 [Betaproteobacteria bacterium]
MDHRFEVMLEPLRAFLAQVGDFLPRLALALIVVIAGWLIAKMVRFAIARGLRKVNFHVITDRAGIDGFLKDGGIRMDATDILAMLVYWIVILVALVVGFNLLGLTYVTELLSKVLLFVPNLQDADLFGNLARYAILAFVVLIALDQVNIGGDIVRETFLILLAGVVFALALAFGLGGREWAAEFLERWWPRKKRP